MTADEIVASVQTDPTGLVAPAVRVLVAEIVRLRNALAHLGKLAEEDHNLLQAEATRLREELADVNSYYESLLDDRDA